LAHWKIAELGPHMLPNIWGYIKAIGNCFGYLKEDAAQAHIDKHVEEHNN